MITHVHAPSRRHSDHVAFYLESTLAVLVAVTVALLSFVVYDAAVSTHHARPARMESVTARTG